MKEYYIVSDLHSRLDLLTKALDSSGFLLENDNHILLIAGDILDRGLEGDILIRFLEKLIDKGRLLMCLGNHDTFLLDIINDISTVKKVVWNIHRNGFATTLQLVCDDEITEELVTQEFLTEVSNRFNEKYPIFIEWLKKQPYYLEYNNHIVVHGFLDFSLDDWHNTSIHDLIWKRGYNLRVPKNFTKNIIFGHTPNIHFGSTDDIITCGKKIMIDGGAANGNQVNVYKLTEEEI